MPSDREVEAGLRNAVRSHFGNEQLTINIVRGYTIKQLALDDNFFDDATWKAKSKATIKDEIAKCEDENIEQGSDREEQALEPVKKKFLKRSSPVPLDRPHKKSKITHEDEDESTALSEPPVSYDESAEDVKPAKKKAQASEPRAQKKSASKPEDDISSELSDVPEEEPDSKRSAAEADEADETSSELSSVVDDPDPPRKKGKAKNGDSKFASKSKTSSKSKPAAEADPNAEEIKKLQGWLVKCGIRKVWGKELKPYETQKAKIAHLKSMLADVGMTGRFSNEKAAQIKEARELAADIEAVQEGNERWGKASGDEDEEEQGRPKRRLIRGAQNYDFLSSDGEETD